MEQKVVAESGLQLLARLYKRPSLLHLDDILFPEGPQPGDIIQISGHSSVGKSLLLQKFLTKCLLPKSYEGLEIGGLEAGVILINTDHNLSILKLVSLMEDFINNVCDTQNKEKIKVLRNTETVEKIITDALKNLIILKTYSSLQLEMNFNSLEKILSGNTTMSLIMIDSLTSYYWSDITNQKSIKKMDLYLKVLIEKLKKCIEEFKMVTVFVTQGKLETFPLKVLLKNNLLISILLTHFINKLVVFSVFTYYSFIFFGLEYFQSKQKEYSTSLIKHKIELKKDKDLDNFLAYVDSQKCVYQYKLTDKGFTWVV